jgi:hypothetical protein
MGAGSTWSPLEKRVRALLGARRDKVKEEHAWHVLQELIFRRKNASGSA